MSASSSSRIDPAIGHLAALGQSLVDERSDVLSVLGQVADPRKRRGVRHTLPVILGVVVCTVLAGARSFVAIAEWAADADDATLADLGAGAVVPCESTIRRTLQTLDADALDDAFGGWAQARTKPSPAVRRRVAVDGKTLRGSGLAGGSGRHLLAALDHVHGVVLGQVDVAAKTNEIPMFATLLDRIDLRGAIVTADAMHAQRGHAEYLVDQRAAHFVLTVKRNQPHLYARLAALPWREVPVGHDARASGHGRAEWRTLKITARDRRIGLSARRASDPDRPSPAAPERHAVVHRDGLCDHLAERDPDQSGRARRRAARSLVHRGPTPLGPRRDVRRGPVPGPHRQRPPRHGQPAQPRDHHLAPDPDRQHRRSPPTPCPTIGPAPTDDHDLLMDFAGALARGPGPPRATSTRRW